MNGIEKQHLMSILDKDKLTMYEVGQLIEYLNKMFSSADGLGRFSEISDEIKEDINNATRAVSGLTKTLTEIYNQIQNGMQAAYEATEKKGEETYQKYKKLTEGINENIKNLDKVEFPNINLPYNWKEVLELSERLSGMSQERREVFYELMKTFTGTK